ncbi:MAG: DUF5683 domain-containing protein [Endomicrobium sp.]|jgi:hypothetical protein|nr:DUF5683 domain-containing protein [Endomicrobium sp.]
MKKIIALLTIAVFLFATNAWAATLDLDFSQRNPVNASLRSLLMPGWGQHYNEDTVKSWIVFGVFAVSAAGAFYYNNAAFKSYEKYDNIGIVNGSYYDDYESQYQISQIFTFVAIGTWIFAVVDAYLSAKKKELSSPETASLKFYYDQRGDGYYLSYSKKIL